MIENNDKQYPVGSWKCIETNNSHWTVGNTYECVNKIYADGDKYVLLSDMPGFSEVWDNIYGFNEYRKFAYISPNYDKLVEFVKASDRENAFEYVFNENDYIEELAEYIDLTYGGHYSKNKIQSTEVIIDRGHGEGFCLGNVDKYSNRYGKKGSREEARKDLMKILHYALIMLYVHDNEL